MTSHILVRTRHPQRGQECWGPQATRFTARQLAAGSTVYLQADQEDTDRYGRYLRCVWTADGRFFNQLAIRQGYARAALYEPNARHIASMRHAERQARNADRGMWGPPCDYDAPVPQPEPQPEPEPEPDAGGGCEAGYDPCVPTSVRSRRIVVLDLQCWRRANCTSSQFCPYG